MHFHKWINRFILKTSHIFVIIYSDPPDIEIRKLMQLHGGKFCHYYNKHVVTHIIATCLPLAKINKLKDEKIVNPQWIIDR